MASLTLVSTTEDVSAHTLVDSGDWIYYTDTGLVRRSGGGSLFSDITRIAPFSAGTNGAGNAKPFSWTNGTPTATGSSVTTNRWEQAYNTDGTSGHQITCRVDSGVRTYKVFVGYYVADANSQGTLELEVSLSDGSATPLSVFPTLNINADTSMEFVITAAAATDNQTITIAWRNNTTAANSARYITIRAAEVTAASGATLISASYDFASSVSNYIAASYSAESTVNNYAAGSYACAHDVYGYVSGGYSLAESVLNFVSASYATASTVINEASSAYSLAYSVINNVAGSYAGEFSVRNSADGSYSGAFEVQSNTIANGSYNGAFGVTGYVVGTYNGEFTVYGIAAADYATSSSVSNFAGGIFDSAFSVQNANYANGSYSESFTVYNFSSGSYAGLFSVATEIILQYPLAGIENTRPLNGIENIRPLNGITRSYP